MDERQPRFSQQGEFPLPQAWWLDHLGSIADSTVEKGAAVTPESRTGRHQRLWAEANGWVDQMIGAVFGAGRLRWVNRPNQYQIGRLSYTYWARIYPEDTGEWGDIFHIGLQISKRLKWVAKAEPELASLLDQPVLALWASTNDRLIEKLGRPDLHAIYGQAQHEVLRSQPELWARGGALVRVGAKLLRAATYVRDVDAGRLPPDSASQTSLFSPLFTAEDVRTDAAHVSRMVAAYLRVLAEPVLAGRAAIANRVDVTPSAPQSPEVSIVAASPPKVANGSRNTDVPDQLRAFAERVNQFGDADVALRDLLDWFGAKRPSSRVMDRLAEALLRIGLGSGGALHGAGMDDNLRFYADGRPPENADLKNAAVAAIMRLLGVDTPTDDSRGKIAHDMPNNVEERAAEYRRDWWGPSKIYRHKAWQVAMPSDLDEITAAARRMTLVEVDAIASRIRQHKVIPSMSFFPMRDGMKNTWWFHPFITVAESRASWVAVDKNGCNLAYHGDEDCTLAVHFTDVASHDLDQVEDSLWRLTLEYVDGSNVTLDEFVPDGAGPYLEILDAILDVYSPVIAASRGMPVWLHGANGEGYQTFDSWNELLRDGGKWLTARRPKQGQFGEVLENTTGKSNIPDSGEDHETDGHTAAVVGALLLEDGGILSWSADNTLKVWDTSTGACRVTMHGHTERVAGALVLPVGDILSWSDDCTHKVWDLSTGKLKSSVVDAYPFLGALVLRDGTILIWGGDMGTFAIAEPDLSEIRSDLEGHEFPVDGARLLADGRVLSWSKDCTLKIWDTDTGSVLQTLQLPLGNPPPGCFVPDGALQHADGNILSWQHDIFGSNPSTLKVWVPSTGECVQSIHAHGGRTAAVCQLTQEYSVSCGHDGTLKVWSLAAGTLEQTLEGHSGKVYGALRLSDDEILSWSEDGALARWDALAGEMRSWLVGHYGAVVGALLLLDGRVLSWGVDNTLRIWDVSSGSELLCLGVANVPELADDDGETDEDDEDVDPDDTLYDSEAESVIRVLSNGARQAGPPAGDMLVDFLMLAGIWPEDLDVMKCALYEPKLPVKVIEASERLFKTLEANPSLWLEVPAALGESCSVVDKSTRAGVLPIDCLGLIPGLESYPWNKRGPLWYSSRMYINERIRGPILFLRDGWVGVDPDDDSGFILNSWESVHSHNYPGIDSTGYSSSVMLNLGDLEIDHFVPFSPPGSQPQWAELSLRLADILLRRILPAARNSVGSLGMRTPPIGQWTKERIVTIMTGRP